MIISPVIQIVFKDDLSNSERMMNPKPMAPITSKMSVWNPASKNNAKFTALNSRSTIQSPRLRRNFLLSDRLPLLLNDRYADVPARKTNMGAHK